MSTLLIAASEDELGDEISVDSNFDPETPAALNARSSSMRATLDHSSSMQANLESAMYDAATIRSEFKTYQSILPKPDELLQNQHSFQILRNTMVKNNIELPRFLKYNNEGGIKPHHALCCLLLNEYEEGKNPEDKGMLVRALSFGYFDRQLNNPADFIRDQFNRVAHVIPADVVKPDVLRKKIRNRGLPIPNYFLDPEDGNQFPPHVALLVILQDGEKESKHMKNILYRMAFSIFAVTALVLRIVLEVIGGAGAIWGGAEVFGLRTNDNRELWRWLSVGVGILCFLRFVNLTLPRQEDVDVLGPAGPWSLRLPVRARAVTEHPFHYFFRATLPPPENPNKKKK